MMHDKRRWCLTSAEDAQSLALLLTDHSWTCCTAFELGDYVFANDATSADGAQEYAVLKRPAAGEPWMQIESITFGWCSCERAQELIEQVLAGKYDLADYRRVVFPRLEVRVEHGTCGHCA